MRNSAVRYAMERCRHRVLVLLGTGVVLTVLVLGGSDAAAADVSYPRIANIYFPTLIGADLEKLARYDVLVLAKRGEEWYRDELAELRELNPDITLLVHMPVGYAGDWEEPSINGDMWAKLFEDDWWMRDCAGDRVRLNCGDYVLNVSTMCPENSRGQMLCDWLPKFIADRLGPGGVWDGVYLDYCMDDISWVNGSLVRLMDADRNGAGDVASELDAAWRAGMERVVSRLRGFVGPEYIIMTNGNNTLYESCDGSTREDFPNMHGGWYENISNSEHGYRAIESNYRRPSINIINAIYHGAADPEEEMPGGAERKLRFTLASTLVYGNGYFSFDGGSGLTDHCQMWWSELYDLDLGEPLGRAEDVTAYPGAAPWVEHPEMIRVRRFSKGLAVVNPTACSQNIQLSGIYYPADGFNGRFFPLETSEAQVDMEYYSGAIYVGNGRVLAGVPAIECELLQDGDVRLVWSEVDGAIEYSVYRTVPPGSRSGVEELIAVVNSPTYCESAVGNRGEYAYRVAPIDEFGCEGQLSAPVAALADNSSDLSVLTMADWPDGQPDLPWREPDRPEIHVAEMSGGRDPEQSGIGRLEPGSGDPVAATLHGCAPNPVHNEAVISFAISDDDRWNGSQHVTLAIYTVAGRCVSRILDTELVPGEHSVVWNRRTSVGARAPAGCYLYALTVAGRVMNGKMVLLH